MGDTVRLELQEGRREVLGMNVYLERATLSTLLREGDMVNSFTVAGDQVIVYPDSKLKDKAAVNVR